MSERLLTLVSVLVAIPIWFCLAGFITYKLEGSPKDADASFDNTFFVVLWVLPVVLFALFAGLAFLAMWIVDGGV